MSEKKQYLKDHINIFGPALLLILPALTHIITTPMFPCIPSLTEKYFSF
ncbi:MAG: hypothetical protein ABW166_19160 [Sedimenticola sp.]